MINVSVYTLRLAFGLLWAFFIGVLLAFFKEAYVPASLDPAASLSSQRRISV